MISYALPVEFELWSKKIQSFLEILKKKIINNMSKIKYTIKEVYQEKMFYQIIIRTLQISHSLNIQTWTSQEQECFDFCRQRL